METPIKLSSVIAFALTSSALIFTTSYATSSVYGTGTKHTSSTSSKSHSKHHAAHSSKARFAATIPATGHGVFVFDPRQHAYGAYDGDGNLVRTGAASGGRDYCPDLHSRCHTPTGTFTVYRVQGAECKSKKFPIGRGGAPMPHCAYFDGGFAVHGSYEVRSYNASHGCIRIHPNEAAWLDQTILRPGSTVIVRPY